MTGTATVITQTGGSDRGQTGVRPGSDRCGFFATNEPWRIFSFCKVV
jgi:hypothetical protein